MPDVERPLSNQILNSLPSDVIGRLWPKIEHVRMKQAMIIYTAGGKIDHFYFPANAVISVVAYEPDGRSVEVGVIGREGMTGMDILLGSNSTPYQHIVQIPNGGVRIRTSAVLEEFERGGEFRNAVFAFMRKMMLQISQTALCNRVHSAEERPGKMAVNVPGPGRIR